MASGGWVTLQYRDRESYRTYVRMYRTIWTLELVKSNSTHAVHLTSVHCSFTVDCVAT